MQQALRTLIPRENFYVNRMGTGSLPKNFNLKYFLGLEKLRLPREAVM